MRLLNSFCCYLLIVPSSYALTGSSNDLKKPFLFDTVLKISAVKRNATAALLYRKTCRKMDALQAMANLDYLNAIAIKLKDKSLQCEVFDMRADYYSVNKGFNALSKAYYQQGIDFAIKNEMPVDVGIRLHRMGLFYRTYKRNTLACQYFLLSQEKFMEAGLENVPHVSVYLSDIASFYYGLGDLETSKTYLLEALRHDGASSRDTISIDNTLGLIYRTSKQYPDAMNYFSEALRLASAKKDSVWINIVNGNIGSVYFLQGNFSKALPLIAADYRSSIKHHEDINGTIALLRLIKIDTSLHHYQTADRKLDTVKKILINTKADALWLWADYDNIKANLTNRSGNAAEALSYMQKYIVAKDSLAKRDNIVAVERMRVSWELDRHNSQISKMQTSEKIAMIKRNALIMLLFLSLVIIALIYNQLRIRTQKKEALLNADKYRVDIELKNAEAELARYTQNIRQNNKLIENITAEVEALKIKTADVAGTAELDNLIRMHIMTDESWTEFKTIFSKVHTGFFAKLQHAYPMLTQTDTRLLALIKLKLSNREMANMLGVTIEGVKKAKQRVKKKIDIPTDIEQDDSVINL